MQVKRPSFFTDRDEKIFSKKLSQDQFMDEDHYMRYHYVYELVKGNYVRLIAYYVIVDDPYKYYVAMLRDSDRCTTFVVGTDDSGKLFSSFRPRCKDDLENAMDTSINFRKALFDFETHFWEEDKTWYILEHDKRVRVRLQGEVIADMYVADSDHVDVFVGTPGGADYIMKKAKENGDKDLYYAMRNLLPLHMASKLMSKLGTKVPYSYDLFITHFNVGEFHSLIAEYLWDAMEVTDKLRIRIGDHIIHARGLKLNSDTFLINPPRLIAFHPQHKKVIFPVHRSVYVRF